MAIKTVDVLKTYFETGDKPTQQQFWDWLDSFLHKTDSIAISQVTNLQTILDSLSPGIAGDRGDLQLYDTDATYVVNAGNLMEKMIVYFPSAGSLKGSIISMGGEDILPSSPIASGWNQPITIDFFAGVDTALYLQGIPVGSKIVFLKSKIKTS